MKFSTLSLITLTALGIANVTALGCDSDCRRTCLSEGLGDDCVMQCGCETFTNGVAAKFAEQQICMRTCKQGCASSSSGSTAECNLNCAQTCN